MKKDIVSILTKKKNITGDDVGKLLIADMSEEMIHFRKTKELKSIISQEEFSRLLDKVQSSLQIERYNSYVTIHNTIRSYYMAHQYLQELATGKLKVFAKILDNVIGGIERDIVEYKSPLVMTQTQYNKALKKCEDEVKGETWNYIEVLCELFRHFSADYEIGREDNPKETPLNKELEAIIDQYKKEPVKDKKLKDLYYKSNYETGTDGYFIFKDFWSIGNTRQEFLKELEIRDIKPIEENLAKYTSKDLNKAPDERFIKDILTPEQIESNLNYELYPEPPKSLCKYDLMDADFITTTTEDKEEQKEAISTLTALMKELPEYTAFILKELGKIKELKPFINVDLKDGFKKTLTGDDLKTADFFNFKQQCCNKFKDTYPRAEDSGLAILKDDIEGVDFKTYDEEDGNFKDTSAHASFLKIQQNAFKDLLTEDHIEREDDIQGTFYSAVLQLNAHNTFIEILADTLGLPNLKEAFSYNMEEIKDEVNTLNTKLKVLLTLHARIYANSGHYREAKNLRKNLFTLLPYFDLSKADITPEAREKAEAFIGDIKNFKGISAMTKPLYILEGVKF